MARFLFGSGRDPGSFEMNGNLIDYNEMPNVYELTKRKDWIWSTIINAEESSKGAFEQLEGRKERRRLRACVKQRINRSPFEAFPLLNEIFHFI